MNVSIHIQANGSRSLKFEEIQYDEFHIQTDRKVGYLKLNPEATDEQVKAALQHAKDNLDSFEFTEHQGNDFYKVERVAVMAADESEAA